MSEGKSRRIGALWKSDPKKGKSVLNGNIDFGLNDKIRIYVMKNDKAGGNAPPYVILAIGPEYKKKPNGGGAKDPFESDDDESPF